MIILIDQDGVLADYNATLYELWREEHPVEFAQHHIPLDKVVDHDLKRLYPTEIKRHLKAIESSPGFFGNLAPIPGAIDALHELVEVGHDVCICTRPAKRAFEQCALDKFKWVKRHLGEAYIERMMIVRDKTFGHGHVLIDDKPEVEGVLVPHWEHILYDQPYNRAVSGKPRLSWDSNWREVLREAEDRVIQQHTQER